MTNTPIKSLFCKFCDFPPYGTGNADLEANKAGMDFWKLFDKDKDKTKFDICDYVTDKWDENINKNTKPDEKPDWANGK